MTDKERLVELCDNIITSCKSSLCADCEHNKIDYPNCMAVHFADYILADGWIRPPCKVGETVYYFSHRPLNLSVQANTVYEATVVRIVTTRLGTQLVIQIRNEYGCTEVPDIRSWGKTVFATKEEAEKALRGGEQG